MRNAMLIKWYRFRISCKLPFGGARKKELMEQLLPGVEYFLENHPDADYKMLTANFGTPNQIAESYWSVNGGRAGQHTAIMMAILRIVAVLALFVAITWGVMVAIVTADFYEEENGDLVVTTSECETVGFKNNNEV